MWTGLSLSQLNKMAHLLIRSLFPHIHIVVFKDVWSVWLVVLKKTWCCCGTRFFVCPNEATRPWEMLGQSTTRHYDSTRFAPNQRNEFWFLFGEEYFIFPLHSFYISSYLTCLLQAPPPSRVHQYSASDSISLGSTDSPWVCVIHFLVQGQRRCRSLLGRAGTEWTTRWKKAERRSRRAS